MDVLDKPILFLLGLWTLQIRLTTHFLRTRPCNDDEKMNDEEKVTIEDYDLASV